MSTSSDQWPSSLDDVELDELDRYLRLHAGEDEDRLLLDGVHGLLSALAVGPLPVAPEVWLPQVLHDAFTDEAEANRVLALLAKLNDSILAELDMDAYEPILGEVETEQGPLVTAAGWCEGFSRGIDLYAPVWEKRLAELPLVLEAVRRYWQEHPPTAAERAALTQATQVDPGPPPRQRSGHWVH